MNFKKQIIVLLLLNSLFEGQVAAQTVLPATTVEATTEPTHLRKIPAAYKTEILAAYAHFPELKDVPVSFRLRKSACTLKTKPSFFSLFRSKEHRRYVIIISNKTAKAIEPISLNKLPEEARIGVLGHELSHVADFSTKSFAQSARCLIGHLSPTYLDRFEFHTDELCIRHGLGKELEAWSAYVRQTMHTANWRGSKYAKKGESASERYMNPETIETYIKHEAGNNTVSQ